MYEDRRETIQKINSIPIPKAMLAAACALDRRRITDFVNYYTLPEATSTKIKTAVAKIEIIRNTFHPFRIAVDSPEILESAFDFAQQRKLQELENNTNG